MILIRCTLHLRCYTPRLHVVRLHHVLHTAHVWFYAFFDFPYARLLILLVGSRLHVPSSTVAVVGCSVLGSHVRSVLRTLPFGYGYPGYGCTVAYGLPAAHLPFNVTLPLWFGSAHCALRLRLRGYPFARLVTFTRVTFGYAVGLRSVPVYVLRYHVGYSTRVRLRCGLPDFMYVSVWFQFCALRC